MTNLTILGQEEYLLGATFRGSPSSEVLVSAIIQLIEVIGMTPDGPPDVAHYPNQSGKGGVGCQVYQKLTESWIVGGTWPVINKTRIVVSSCKPFTRGVVISLLEKLIGPMIPGVGGHFDY